MNVKSDNTSLASTWVQNAMDDISQAIDVNEMEKSYSSATWDRLMDAWTILEDIRGHLDEEESGEAPRSKSIDLY